MQITLNQKEIEKAIIAFVGNQGIAITGKNVAVSLVAGRGANGMSATIDISNDQIEAPTVIEVATDIDDEIASEEVEEETEEAASSKQLFGK